MWSNLVAPIRNSLGAMQQLPLAPIGAPIRSNLEGSSSWELLAIGAKGSSYEALRGAPRLLVMEDPNELLLGAPRSSSYEAHTESSEAIPRGLSSH